jgi:hypothetical protein
MTLYELLFWGFITYGVVIGFFIALGEHRKNRTIEKELA